MAMSSITGIKKNKNSDVNLKITEFSELSPIDWNTYESELMWEVIRAIYTCPASVWFSAAYILDHIDSKFDRTVKLETDIEYLLDTWYQAGKLNRMGGLYSYCVS